MKNFIIQNAEKKHLSEIIFIEKSSFEKPWSDDSLKNELNFGNSKNLVVFDEKIGKVAGYLFSRLIFKEIELLNIAVAPGYRKQGAGRFLMAALEEFALSNDFEAIFLEVDISNSAAIQLYRDFHFTEIGRRADYYGKGKDALVLQKSLTSKVF